MSGFAKVLTDQHNSKFKLFTHCIFFLQKSVMLSFLKHCFAEINLAQWT